jgi:hypothetical protein
LLSTGAGQESSNSHPHPYFFKTASLKPRRSSDVAALADGVSPLRKPVSSMMMWSV